MAARRRRPLAPRHALAADQAVVAVGGDAVPAAGAADRLAARSRASIVSLPAPASNASAPAPPLRRSLPEPPAGRRRQSTAAGSTSSSDRSSCSRRGFVVSLAADWHEPRPSAQPFAGRGVASPREAYASAFTEPRRPRRWSARSHRGLRAPALLGGRAPTGTAPVARVPPRGSVRRRRRFRAERSWPRSVCGGAR
jgi:hypothetical protein